MKPLPTGTITFLFTDIEGSTKLWEAQPDAMRVAVARHDALLRQAVEINGGYLFKTTGDGVAAAFALAPDALAATLAAQIALAAEPWPEAVTLRSRMSLHTGAAELRDGDYFGSTLNRCARLMAAGHGGQTLLSDVTHELTRDSLPPEVSFLPLGEQRLKDLTRPETVYQLAHPALVAAFLPLRTLDNPDMPNNLPQQVTSFIGREKPLAEVAALLAKTRLLTLTGSGGSGKTRLSLQAAADVLEQYPDGVWLVELAALADPSLVPQTVAAALGVREQPGQNLMQTLTDFLKPKRLLLVLDNCEHVLAACATLVAALLRASPGVKALATSREPLGIAGETTYRVPALSLPSASQAKSATPESLTQFEAVQLFIERAQAVKPDFAVTNANAPALAQLCFRLDGIPLAIELAAARVRSLPVEQINDKLDSRFRLLTGGDRSALPRQQTLRALIDWSYDLLNENEKTLLARLSVFAGGWTLEAAEAVGGFDPVEDFEVLDLLTSLADKSLVLAEEESGNNRYRMLETILQYSGERLAASGEAADVAIRHREFFVALAEEAEPHLTGPEQVLWMNLLETEHDNIRAALDACAAEADDTVLSALSALSGLRLSGTMWRFWYVRGYVSEGREQLARALATRSMLPGTPASDSAADDAKSMQPQAQKAIATALRAGGTFADCQGDYAAARSLYQESLILSREIGDRRGIALTLNNLGILAHTQGDYAAARVLLEESLVLFRENGDKRGGAHTPMHLGIVAHKQGDSAEAKVLLEESLVLFREIGDKRGVALALMHLGIVASWQGDGAAARSLHEESLSLFREVGDKRGVAVTLIHLGRVTHRQSDDAAARLLYGESLSINRELGEKHGIAYGLKGLASVCVSEGNARRALVLWAAAGALLESIGAPMPPADQAKQDAETEPLRAEMGEAAFAAAWDEGWAMAWERAMELALKHAIDDNAPQDTTP